MINDYQNKLFPYAYNILGSSEEARDTVQDVVIKYLKTDKQQVENEQAYLIKGVINQSINTKKRRSRETTLPVWLPEPLSTDNPDSGIRKEEILSYSLLVLLEKLSPKERAVFILKEAFDYSHKDLAQAFDYSEENARKILSRAKKKLATHKKARDRQTAASKTVLKRYLDCLKANDVSALEELFQTDIQVAADGGPDINVVRHLTNGGKPAANLMAYVYQAFLKEQQIRFTQLNHQPALLFYEGDRLRSCQVFKTEGDKISMIYSVIDPEKLQAIA